MMWSRLREAVSFRRGKGGGICILMPYFGRWPEWMELYLESCRRNPQIDWIFFSDCGEPARGWPPNVLCHRMQLSDFLRLAERKAGIEIRWTEPYKICDLRPAFGDIFESWIEGYDYFGWGDIDVIYGDMAGFLAHELLQHDCVSFSSRHLSGHLCLWRNTEAVRKWYRQVPDWRKRMEDMEYTHFDEVPPSTVPAPLKVYAQYSFNTPLSPHFPWTDGTFDCPSEWTWKDGRLTNDKDGDREFLYLHFMHWKGGWWPRQCGNAQWEKLDKLVHLEPGECAHGFRVTENGFLPLEPERGA